MYDGPADLLTLLPDSILAAPRPVIRTRYGGAVTEASADDRPVVAVANRLPVQHGDDGWELSPGGLVTALRPVMTTHSGAWVGWDGGTKGMPPTLPDSGVRLQPISLSATQIRNYYHGFANATLWPLLHDAIEKPRLRAVLVVHLPGRERGVRRPGAGGAGRAAGRARLGARLPPDAGPPAHPRAAAGAADRVLPHVPWPPPDLFARLPWREQILVGLLGADVVAFHTERYRSNFVAACGRLLSSSGIQVRGTAIALPDGRLVETVAAPISIDAADFIQHATAPETDADVAALTDQFAGRTLLLGVDRLDYTKGIVERLLAVEMLLERTPEYRTSLALLQVAVPSRDNVREYRQLRGSVEQNIGRINGRFTEPGNDVPVHYLYRGLTQQQLAAYYAAADACSSPP